MTSHFIELFNNYEKGRLCEPQYSAAEGLYALCANQNKDVALMLVNSTADKKIIDIQLDKKSLRYIEGVMIMSDNRTTPTIKKHFLDTEHRQKKIKIPVLGKSINFIRLDYE